MKKLLPLFLVLILSACTIETEPVEVQINHDDTEMEEEIQVIEDEEEPELELASAILDFDNLEVGQKIGGMALKSIGKPNGNSQPISGHNIKLEFEGEITLKGELEYFGDEHMALSNKFCMKNLTEESLAQLPHREGDENSEWSLFCFENSQDISAAIGIGGQEDILSYVIDRYTFIGFEGEAVNLAHFVRL